MIAARVITIIDHPDSIAAADRCIASAKPFGLTVTKQSAWTPKNNPAGIFAERHWSARKFAGNPYCRIDAAMACYLSHATLWQEVVETKQTMIVLEHDAVMVRALPDLDRAGQVCNLGAPSFGTFKTPPCGNGPLVSKPFMPGAHAYLVTPKGAADLLAKAIDEAEPTDVFMSLKRFPFLRENYPWPFECHDSFSTIQLAAGCVGKHNKVRIV